MADSNCGSCDLSKATFKFAPIAGLAPMIGEGDLVTWELDETEFNDVKSHDGSLLIGSFNKNTDVKVTVFLFPCSDWYRAIFSAWKKDKGICGDIIANDPCCDVHIFERARITKMGVKPISYSNDAVEIEFKANLPTG